MYLFDAVTLLGVRGCSNQVEALVIQIDDLYDTIELINGKQ